MPVSYFDQTDAEQFMNHGIFIFYSILYFRIRFKKKFLTRAEFIKNTVMRSGLGKRFLNSCDLDLLTPCFAINLLLVDCRGNKKVNKMLDLTNLG